MAGSRSRRQRGPCRGTVERAVATRTRHVVIDAAEQRRADEAEDHDVGVYGPDASRRQARTRFRKERTPGQSSMRRGGARPRCPQRTRRPRKEKNRRREDSFLNSLQELSKPPFSTCPNQRLHYAKGISTVISPLPVARQANSLCWAFFFRWQSTTETHLEVYPLQPVHCFSHHRDN